MITSRQQRRDARFARSTCRAAGRARRITRVLGVAVAGSLGALLIAVLTAVPGPRRERRGTWALQHSARWTLRSIGIRTVIYGAPRSGPTLVVGNHTSWLDVLVLASATPMIMVAKSEIRSWPLIGRAAVAAGTVFVHRDRLRALPDTIAEITAILRSGSRVQVFPEGTTRCGRALGQFHRAAFQAAIDAAVVVSPVTIGYTQAGQTPTTTSDFLGGETVASSLSRVLRSRGITATVRWLSPIPAIAGTGKNYVDRAAVARQSENAVARSLQIPLVDCPVHRIDGVTNPNPRLTQTSPTARTGATPSGSHSADKEDQPGLVAGQPWHAGSAAFFARDRDRAMHRFKLVQAVLSQLTERVVHTLWQQSNNQWRRCH